MDQSDLMFVRDTLDGVVLGNTNLEDAVHAAALVASDITDVVAVVAGNESSDIANTGAMVPYEGDGDDTDGDEIPF